MSMKKQCVRKCGSPRAAADDVGRDEIVGRTRRLHFLHPTSYSGSVPEAAPAAARTRVTFHPWLHVEKGAIQTADRTLEGFVEEESGHVATAPRASLCESARFMARPL